MKSTGWHKVSKKAKVWSGTQCSLYKLADELNQVFYWIDIQNVLCWCTSRIRVRKHSFLDKCWSWVDLCSLADQILNLYRCCFLWEHRGTLSWGQTETSQADLWGDDELPARYFITATAISCLKPDLSSIYFPSIYGYVLSFWRFI